MPSSLGAVLDESDVDDEIKGSDARDHRYFPVLELRAVRRPSMVLMIITPFVAGSLSADPGQFGRKYLETDFSSGPAEWESGMSAFCTDFTFGLTALTLENRRDKIDASSSSRAPCKLKLHVYVFIICEC